MKNATSSQSEVSTSHSTKIIPFTFESKEVRIVPDESGNPWWVAKDVCDVLGHTNPSIAMEMLDEDERSKKSLGRQGDAWVISESGLYTLIIRSNKPEARKFRKWITSEVLPQIRKTGAYHLETVETKRCSKCGAQKPLSDFSRDPGRASGYRSACKACDNESRKRLYHARKSDETPSGRFRSNNPETWMETWEMLCQSNDCLKAVVEKLYYDVLALMPDKSIRPIPKDADVLEYIRLHYSEMEKAARQIGILADILLWRSPRVAAFNMALDKPRY